MGALQGFSNDRLLPPPGQVGWSLEPPGPMEVVSAHGRDGSKMILKVPSSPDDSVIPHWKMC